MYGDWEVENFSNSYRNWLMSEMDGYSYRILFDQLYDTEYTWILPRDEDRAVNGVYLRARFEYESGLPLPDGWEDWPCSFLEFVAAMAFSIRERIAYDPEDDIPASEWFWEMMGNIGLDEYDDERMLEDPSKSYQMVDFIVKRVMDRRYNFKGVGGLFPLNDTELDQREVEYWYQMNSYMMERG